jgi:hypothetical protein
MLDSKKQVAVGAFEDREHAREALDALREAGFSDDELRLTDEPVTGVEPEAVQLQRTGYAGGMLGALFGAGLGAVLGGLVGGVVTLSPGLALLWALVGLCAGAALGVFGGPFVAMENDDKALEPRRARSVLVVNSPARLRDAESILREHGAYDHSMRAP